MIRKEKIEHLVGEKLTEDMFIVDLKISASNVISVLIDSFKGVDISTCVAISRHIENSLDREEEDFALEVSSAGLGQPFKVRKQYLKNVGREIEVITGEGVKFEGVLVEATDEGIKLDVTTKEKPEGSKKKIYVTRTHEFLYNQINSAKNIISFK